MITIAVAGASGFVGATFVERMMDREDVCIRPLIRSSGNAWRLARHGRLQLQTTDLMSESEVKQALEGCTHVVNCSRGNPGVMSRGLDNLLRAAQAAGAKRFVHLSSVAVYGDPPHPQSEREDAPTEPVKGSYGWIKLQQDRRVMKAAAAGLPATILCPPYISGAYSTYLLGLVDAIRRGRFPLVDEGRLPCNLVDVENLSYAIERALFASEGNGERLFVTDGEATTWADLAAELAPLAGRESPLPCLPLDQARKRVAPAAGPSASIKRTVKHLVSADVNRALRQDPYLEKVDDLLRLPVKGMGKELKGSLKYWLRGPQRVRKIVDRDGYDDGIIATQLRGVRHSCAKARTSLGYEPPLGFGESMAIFREWYSQSFGLNRDSWDLARELLSV